MNIQEKKKQRFEFLKNVYESTDGNEHAMVDGTEVGMEIGVDDYTSQIIVQYLIGEGLLENRGIGIHIAITHAGIVEVEEALQNPDKPTQHFLPVNFINIGSMVNSTIQQGSAGATQFVETKIKESTPDIKAFLSELRDSINKLNLSVENQNEMMSEIQTIEIQTNSPKPKPTIIQESLKSIRTILEGVATEAVAPMFIQKVVLLLSMFSS